jgi:hypothetical protein
LVALLVLDETNDAGVKPSYIEGMNKNNETMHNEVLTYLTTACIVVTGAKSTSKGAMEPSASLFICHNVRATHFP